MENCAIYVCICLGVVWDVDVKWYKSTRYVTVTEEFQETTDSESYKRHEPNCLLFSLTISKAVRL